jgi:N-acetyl-anhydromuramyl-L-alanine amidase AmpD
VFANGLYDSKAVIASKDFSHSYSNPIWYSDWHFYNMHPGKHHSDFVNRFNSDKMYREIDISDVEDMIENLSKYGKAYRECDLEAIEETQQVIKFCERHLENPEITIIYESEV